MKDDLNDTQKQKESHAESNGYDENLPVDHAADLPREYGQIRLGDRDKYAHQKRHHQEHQKLI